MSFFQGRRISVKTGVGALAMALLLGGCEQLGTTGSAATPDTAVERGGTSIEKDVERPDIFSVTENALWDGRPSLGGVWVAYPSNTDPERVVIRNGANGKSVIGALFRRERENPGPKIQLSSDAATALGVIAGTPTEISITVLRRETVEIAPPPETATPETATPETAAPTTSGGVANMTAPPRRAAPAATPAHVADQGAENGAGLTAIVAQTLADVVNDAAVEAAPAQPLFRLRKPYIQVASFAEQPRAIDLVAMLATEGVTAIIQANDPENATLYRVYAGPFNTRAERAAQLRIITGLGFTDAFFFK